MPANISVVVPGHEDVANRLNAGEIWRASAMAVDVVSANSRNGPGRCLNRISLDMDAVECVFAATPATVAV